MATTRNSKGTKSSPRVSIREALTPHSLRTLLRERGIAESLTAFAADIGRSRTSLYFALENPKRYPLTYRHILKAIEQ